MIINVKDFGISSGEDITEKLAALIKTLSLKSEVKTVVFEKGQYYFDAEKCQEVYRAITNTAAKNEYKDKSRVNLHKTPFLFENVSNLIFDGCGSEFIVDGKVTNMIISSCENVTFRNFTFKTINPNIHRFTVKKTSAFKTVFSLNKESVYKKEGNGYVFTGKGFRFGFTETAKFSSWNIVNYPENKNAVIRGLHPFRGALSVKETAPYEFTVRYIMPQKFKVGQSFHIYDCLRSDVGIFIENSKNIAFENVVSTFNYSLAYVAQCCENLTLQNCRFEPEEGSELLVSSLADFMQVCMCKGKIVVRDCNFEGAGDDAINVHGVHFKIKDTDKNSFSAVFSHPQTWGFNPFSEGDEIAFVDPKSLLEKDSAKVVCAELISDQEIRIIADKDIPRAYEKYAVENKTLCPELEYTGNTISKVVTRGILYTSRGRCVIKNNRFVNTGMSAVLFSDDAENWFESGMCKDVLIENNTFEETGENAILILPENKVHEGAVHSNFTIKDNRFKKYKGVCVSIKSTENVLLKGNSFADENKLSLKYCVNVTED